MFRTFTVTALLALTITAAHAADKTEASVDVPFGDLNLTHPQDAKILAGRLRTAARQVCLPAVAGGGSFEAPVMRQEMQACMMTAFNVAMARIESKLDNAVRVHLVANNDTQ
jgi:UrcA family protein